MIELATVQCPSCSEETDVLVPKDSEPVGAEMELDLPAGADTSVWSTCSDDHRFVVYLQEP